MLVKIKNKDVCHLKEWKHFIYLFFALVYEMYPVLQFFFNKACVMGVLFFSMRDLLPELQCLVACFSPVFWPVFQLKANFLIIPQNKHGVMFDV